MRFSEAFITNSGRSLIERATASDLIVWGSCACYEDDINDLSIVDINSLTGSEFLNPVAIGGASAVFDVENDLVKITCEVSNDAQGVTAGYANSFALFAKIDGDENETLVAVARTGSGVPGTYFGDYSDARSRLFGVLDLSLELGDSHAATTINVTTSGVALSQDLQAEIDYREALESRVVTTHSSSSESIGEDQSIRGVKDFIDGAKFLNIQSNLVPRRTDQNLGSSLYRWAECYTWQVYTQDAYVSNIKSNGSLNIQAAAGNDVRFQSNISILPSDGSIKTPRYDISGGAEFFDSVNPNNSQTNYVQFNCNVTVRDGLNIGKELELESKLDFVGPDGSRKIIGCEELSGVIPNMVDVSDKPSDMDIGCISLLFAESISSDSNVKKAGSVIKDDTGFARVAIAELKNENGFVRYDDPVYENIGDMEFKTLTSCRCPTGASAVSPFGVLVLAIRVK